MKTRINLFISGFIFILPFFLFSQTPDIDLIAYWSFDDSTAADNSGHGYHGYLVNNPKPDVGIKGACFRFKGKNAYIEENQSKTLIGDHIMIPRIPFENYSEFTITMWVNEENLDFVGGSGYLFFGEVFNAWAGIYHAGHYPDPTLWVKFSTGSVNDVDEPIKFDYKSEFNGKWIFYALVYKNNIMSAYINGKPFMKKYQPVLISGSRAGISTNWWFYGGEHRQSAAFTGRIDEVKIYKRALTDEELSLDSIPCKTWFNYPNFSNTKNITFTGNATKLDSSIRLTNNIINDVGAIWHANRLPVNNNFTTEFSFKFTNGSNNNSDDGSLPGADGIVFVIQNQGNLALGASGGDIGYSGINNAVAIEYDTYYNGAQQIENYYDPNGNHVALIVSDNGVISAKHNPNNTLVLNDKIITLENDKIYYSKIEYNYSEKRLRVYLDRELPIDTIVIDFAPIDLPNLIKAINNTAFMGITSGTGSAFEKHFILNWEFCSESSPVSDIEESNYIDEKIQISPNPANDKINMILNDNNCEIHSINIRNIIGEIVSTHKFYNKSNIYQVDISEFSSGLYFIELNSYNLKYIGKFIKI